MLDELFGEANRLAILNWEKSYSPRNDKGHVSTATEYVLVYARDAAQVATNALDRTASMNAAYKSPDGDPRLWKPFGDLSAGKGRQNQGMVYAIQSPFTGELHYPPPGRCWSLAKTELKRALEDWGVEYRSKRLDDDQKRAELLSIDPTEIKSAAALMIRGRSTMRARTPLRACRTSGHASIGPAVERAAPSSSGTSKRLSRARFRRPGGLTTTTNCRSNSAVSPGPTSNPAIRRPA